MIYRAAPSHGLNVGDASLRQAISLNNGHSWSNRITEEIIESLQVVGDEFDARPSDPYSPSVTLLSDGRLCLKYERDYEGNKTQASDGPERLVFVRFAEPVLPLVWSAPVLLPYDPDLWRYTSAGGKVIELPNGDLLSFDYFRLIGASRYTSFVSRSQDGGQTWAFLSIVFDDPPGPTNRQFEEPMGVRLTVGPNAGRIVSLARVDDSRGPGSGDFTPFGMIYAKDSDDDANTWGEIREAFPGVGWPSVIELKQGVLAGVLVAISRSTVDQRPEMWLSLDGGRTWGNNIIFGNNDLFDPVEVGTQGNGLYMYGEIYELGPGHIAVYYGQDSGGGTTSNGLVYQEFFLDRTPELPAYISKQAAFWDNANTSWISYAPWTGLYGVTDLTLSFRVRKELENGGTQHYWSIGQSGNQQFRTYIGGATLTFSVSIATAAGTEAHWTSPANFLRADYNAHIAVVYTGGGIGNAGRLRVWRDLVDVTDTGTFSGQAMPATLRTNFTTPVPCIGGLNTNGGNIRLAWLDDVALWVGYAADADDIEELYNERVSQDLRLISFGPPTVWVDFEGDFEDRMGTLQNPVLNGSGVSLSREWVHGPGYLVP